MQADPKTLGGLGMSEATTKHFPFGSEATNDPGGKLYKYDWMATLGVSD